jgi:autotransporter-associated beta strand protein
MCPFTFSINKPCALLLIVFSMGFSCFGQTTFDIKWGTHHALDGLLEGTYYESTDTNFSTAKAATILKSLSADGTLGLSLVNDVDLIEIGFFDTDSSDDGTESTISPNTSTSDLFKGVWTPLSSITNVGQDYNTAGDVGAGEFYFESRLRYDGSDTQDRSVMHNNGASLTIGTSSSLDILDYNTDPSTFAASNLVEDRVNALYAQSFTNSNPVPLGIRFYDAGGGPISGSTRYNTIMSTDWVMDWDQIGSAELDLLEWYDPDDNDPSTNDGDESVIVRDSLVFEFDNSDANTANTSKVGNSDSQITSNDFVTTITYHDGSSNLDVSSASHVLSGLTGTTSTVIFGGTNEHVVTLNSQSGNTGSDAFDFEGNFSRAASGSESTESTDITIIKTGAGDQILSGNINLADSNTTSASGGLNITSGNLILKPASGKTQVVEYLTGAGGLKLDNSGVNDGTIVTLGFANQTSSTFSGTVVLDGNGSAGEAKIKVSKSRDESGFVDSDFGDTQTLSGVISNANGNKTMVKDGTGTLELTNTNTFSGGVRIEDGTLIAGNSQALGNTSNTITINKGKLEVANSVTLNSGYTVTTSTGTDKTMVGGRGDLNGNITIGSATTAGFVDVISPGDGISSSLTNNQSLQQVSLGSRTNAIGEFTVGALTLENGGVYDWEVSDFTNAGDDTKAGVDWDLLKFDSLTFDHTTDTITLNIMGLASDGTAGTMGGSAGNVWNSYQGTNGFLFMEGTWTGAPSAGTLSSGFTIQDDGWQHYNSHHLNEWSVYWDGTDSFYLQYSAVPEPSTYMMVTGLLMVPGMSYLRRIRRKKDSDQEETSL